MGNKIMAYWDCQYCGAKAHRGDMRNCTGCGHPRDESVTFYMLDKEYVSDEEAAKISAGPDWYCPYCSCLNKSEFNFCAGCGASKEASSKDYFQIQEEKKQKELERLRAEAENNPPAPTLAEEPKKKKKKRWWLWLLLLVLIGSAVICLWPKTKDAVVSEHAWTTAVNYQENTYFEETDWSVPYGATELDHWEDVYGYDQVLDHYEDVQVAKQREITVYETVISYEDLGNGYFEEVSTEVPHTEYETYYETESQPVYVAVPINKIKYRYSIWRWVDKTPITKSGSGTDPEYPTIDFESNKRETGRSTTYILKVTEGGSTYKFAVDQSTFASVADGTAVTVKSQGASRKLLDASGKTIGYEQ